MPKGMYGQGATHKEGSGGKYGAWTAPQTKVDVKGKQSVGMKTVMGSGNDMSGKKLPGSRKPKKRY